MASRETENNAYAKFWGDKQRALWYVMVFLEWSIPTGLAWPEENTNGEMTPYTKPATAKRNL